MRHHHVMPSRRDYQRAATSTTRKAPCEVCGRPCGLDLNGRLCSTTCSNTYAARKAANTQGKP